MKMKRTALAVFTAAAGIAFADGRQAAGLFRDGVHPLPAGYEVYAQELNRILKEINRH